MTTKIVDHPALANLRSLDDVLHDHGNRQELMLQALKRGLAIKLARAMKDRQLSKVEMARRMGTSRAQLDRVLDPESANVTLDTLSRAAFSVGKELQLEFR